MRDWRFLKLHSREAVIGGTGRMSRRIEGVSTMPINPLRAGLSWFASQRAQYRWRGQKPHCTLRLDVLEPKELAGRLIAGHVYAQPKALW